MRIFGLVTALTAVAWAAALPASGADVHIGINLGVPLPPPAVVVAEPPPLYVVPETPVQYVPSLPYNCFFYHDRYYSMHRGAWFYGPSYHGPWVVVAPHHVPRPVLAVPVAYYRVPPGHWHHEGHGHRGGHGHGHGGDRHEHHGRHR
jgi:hypothetical protein